MVNGRYKYYIEAIDFNVVTWLALRIILFYYRKAFYHGLYVPLSAPI